MDTMTQINDLQISTTPRSYKTCLEIDLAIRLCQFLPSDLSSSLVPNFTDVHLPSFHQSRRVYLLSFISPSTGQSTPSTTSCRLLIVCSFSLSVLIKADEEDPEGRIFFLHKQTLRLVINMG